MTLTTAPAQFYTDPAIFARERQAIFATSWLYLGLASDLVRTGDYLSDILADFPIVVVRDEHGVLKGYHNVCRHRAGPLVGDGKGRCDHNFVCRFHAWEYDFSGRLTATGDFPLSAAVDHSQFGLFPIRVETWRGFIFVNLDLKAAPLSDTLAPLDAAFGAPRFFPARLQHSHKVACNWKVFVENYLDGYHLEGVHPGLASRAGDQRHDVSLVGQVALCAPQPERGEEKALWAWVWPNLGFFLYRDVLLVEHMRPDGPGRTRLDHLYMHEPEDPRIDAAMADSERLSDEDAWICERVQRNLAAGVYNQGVFAPELEGAVAWFQNRIVQALSLG